jgi:hypothetical protein
MYYFQETGSQRRGGKNLDYFNGCPPWRTAEVPLEGVAVRILAVICPLARLQDQLCQWSCVSVELRPLRRFMR